MSETTTIDPSMLTPTPMRTSHGWRSHDGHYAPGQTRALDVFCARTDTPNPLLETKDLFVVADRFPCCRGHILIIPKDHYRCWGAAPAEVLDQRERATELVSAFLKDTLGRDVLTWENGIAGQEVPHAHRHVWPTTLHEVPVMEGDPGCHITESGADVRDWYMTKGPYFELTLNGTTHLYRPSSQSLQLLSGKLAATRPQLQGADQRWVENAWKGWERTHRGLVLRTLPEVVTARGLH